MDIELQNQLSELLQQTVNLVLAGVGFILVYLFKKAAGILEQKFHSEKESLLRGALEGAMQNALNVGAERLREAGKIAEDPGSAGQALALNHILDDAVAYLQKTNPEALQTFNLDPVTLRHMVMARAVARPDIPTSHAPTGISNGNGSGQGPNGS